IGKDSLSDKEKVAAQAYTKEKGILPPSPDADVKANPTGDSAAAIYNRVKGEKRIPLVRLPYMVEHTVEVKNGNLIIPHKEDEVRIAQLADKYTTSDGYIFDEHDIISDEGDAYVTPHMGHSHWIGKDSLSDKEKVAAQA
ncbi:pneumococcal-type histidine triad protein, partial [Streptococcus pneumoniae]|nr:pneumococcal-type histidine triad protein [Streptococcus pneumoniae]